MLALVKCFILYLTSLQKVHVNTDLMYYSLFIIYLIESTEEEMSTEWWVLKDFSALIQVMCLQYLAHTLYSQSTVAYLNMVYKSVWPGMSSKMTYCIKLVWHHHFPSPAENCTNSTISSRALKCYFGCCIFFTLDSRKQISVFQESKVLIQHLRCDCCLRILNQKCHLQLDSKFEECFMINSR